MDSPHCSCKLTRVRERHQRRVLRGRHLQRRPSVRAHPHSPCSKCRLSSIKMALITSNGCSYTKSASTIVILRWADGNWYISDLGDSRTPADGNDIDYFSEAHTPARPLAKQRQAASKQQASSKQRQAGSECGAGDCTLAETGCPPQPHHSLGTAASQGQAGCSWSKTAPVRWHSQCLQLQSLLTVACPCTAVRARPVFTVACLSAFCSLGLACGQPACDQLDHPGVHHGRPPGGGRLPRPDHRRRQVRRRRREPAGG